MYSWAMRSSSSVVTPGATALPASASAPAAIRPATRIFSITSGVCTHGSLPSRAVCLPTYSGRGIDLGTGSVGDSTPGRRAVRTGMTSAYRRGLARAYHEPADAIRFENGATVAAMLSEQTPATSEHVHLLDRMGMRGRRGDRRAADHRDGQPARSRQHPRRAAGRPGGHFDRHRGRAAGGGATSARRRTSPTADMNVHFLAPIVAGRLGRRRRSCGPASGSS